MVETGWVQFPGRLEYELGHAMVVLIFVDFLGYSSARVSVSFPQAITSVKAVVIVPMSLSRNRFEALISAAERMEF